MTEEPILHLAKRAIKEPESLRAFEIRKLALWVEQESKRKDRELGRIYPGDPAYRDPFTNPNVWKINPNTGLRNEAPFEGLHPYKPETYADIVSDAMRRLSELDS